MSSTSPRPTFAESAERLAALNMGAAPNPPPAVCLVSPLHELLIAEIAAGVPKEFRAALLLEPSVERVSDWLAASAVLRWIQHDPEMAAEFTREARSDPKLAAHLFAKTIAARFEPPPRSAAWHRSDKTGLFLELVGAAAILLVRGLIMIALVVFPATHRWQWAALLDSISGASLVSIEFSSLFNTSLSFGVIGAWLLAEVGLGLNMLEHIRQWPARTASVPPPLNWRRDTFYTAWICNVSLVLAIIIIRLTQSSIAAAATPAVVVFPIATAASLLMGWAWVLWNRYSRPACKSGLGMDPMPLRHQL